MSKILDYSLPQPHLIIEDFLTKEDNEKIYSLTKKGVYERGKFRVDNEEKISIIKRNWNTTGEFNGLIRDIFHKAIFSKPMRKFFSEHRNPLYKTILNTDEDTTLVSIYRDGDYYGYHRDLFNYMACVYLVCKEPKTFSGGDLILKYNNELKRIPFKNNTLIVFATSTEHAVSIVKSPSGELEDARISVQYWAYKK